MAFDPSFGPTQLAARAAYLLRGNDLGVMTSRIKGDSAKMLSENDIEVHGLTMEFYKTAQSNRTVEMRVTSPR